MAEETDYETILGHVLEWGKDIITAEPVLFGVILWTIGLKFRKREGDAWHRIADLGAGICIYRMKPDADSIIGEAGELLGTAGALYYVGRAATGAGYAGKTARQAIPAADESINVGTFVNETDLKARIAMRGSILTNQGYIGGAYTFKILDPNAIIHGFRLGYATYTNSDGKTTVIYGEWWWPDIAAALS